MYFQYVFQLLVFQLLYNTDHISTVCELTCSRSFFRTRSSDRLRRSNFGF